MPVVLDISSDEEDGLKEGPERTDFDWIKDLLFTSDEESDDSDEVVIVHENKPKLKSKSFTLTVKDVDDDDDDDCVVLEGDPENRVTSVDEEPTGSDELLVVGETGQVACRDYPHARHLCAKFPFSSTPHERHCGQCHCYVCDSLAPCLKWGTGILSSDHCHANDKTELWKIQRKQFKLGQSSPLPASTNYGTSLRAVHPQCNEILPRDIIHLSPNSVLQNQASRSTAMPSRSSLNSISQNQASRPTITFTRSSSLNSSVQNQVSRPINIPVCPTASNLTIPNGANRGRCQESRYTLVRNRYRPHTVPRQFLGVRSHAIQRERGSGASSLGPQFLRPHVMSEGAGSPRDTLTMNHSSHGSSGFNNHVNGAQQCDKSYTTAGFSKYRNCNRPDDNCHPINLPFFSPSSSGPASLSFVNQHTVTSETQSYGQPLSQSNDSQDFHQTCIAPSSYVACLNSNQHGTDGQIRSQNENANGNIAQSGITNQDTCQPKPHEESPSENARKFSAFDSSWTENTSQSIEPSQNENANGNIAQNGITNQDTCQPKPHEESPSENARKFSAFDSSWTENTSQSIEPVIEYSPLQNSGSIDQPPNMEESGAQFTGSIDPLIEYSHLPRFDIEDWLSDIDSLPMVSDGVLPSELNIPSPDLVPVDAGMFLFYGGE